jgi:hypothetical protein
MNASQEFYDNDYNYYFIATLEMKINCEKAAKACNFTKILKQWRHSL